MLRLATKGLSIGSWWQKGREGNCPGSIKTEDVLFGWNICKMTGGGVVRDRIFR